jgi:hypothetical protein
MQVAPAIPIVLFKVVVVVAQAQLVGRPTEMVEPGLLIPYQEPLFFMQAAEEVGQILVQEPAETGVVETEDYPILQYQQQVQQIVVVVAVVAPHRDRQ